MSAKPGEVRSFNPYNIFDNKWGKYESIVESVYS